MSNVVYTVSLDNSVNLVTHNKESAIDHVDYLASQMNAYNVKETIDEGTYYLMSADNEPMFEVIIEAHILDVSNI